ncbi:unnamed protein product [Ambrosiozyma monospora]|uniref:Unnamed protein product n=1 Tax=Ambrosiozyma monospora TaxID=43982 RepID=A0ACB5TJ71_AMBMO|nr:unnamed protein product [Ambrosiozyma monospora]
MILSKMWKTKSNDKENEQLDNPIKWGLSEAYERQICKAYMVMFDDEQSEDDDMKSCVTPSEPMYATKFEFESEDVETEDDAQPVF